LARGLAQRLGWEFLEGDELHPRANVEKMAAGVPLTDEDRWPWLKAIVEWIEESAARGRSAAVTCSALRRAYRDRLRQATACVRFCQVTVDAEVLRRRLEGRTGHYMPASLLPSQLATLEPLAADEAGAVVTAEGDPADLLAEAMHRLGLDPP
jgi:gluconokinase